MKKIKYYDLDEVYSEKELQELHEWIEDHIEPTKKIHLNKEDSRYLGYPYKSLDNLISGSDIELLASIDLGRIQGFDYEIIRLMMNELDPFPVKISGSPVYYYHAVWKNIFDPTSSEKWRVE